MENGIDTKPIHKLGHGRPDILDTIKNGEIQLIINSPRGKMSRERGSYIRRAAIAHKIPIITTVAAALAAAKGIEARRKGQTKVKSLQIYHKDIK